MPTWPSFKDAAPILGIIKKHGRAGKKGDGLVFVTPVEQAVRIHNGKPWKDRD